MNFEEAPSWLKAADAHAMAADGSSIFDDIAESVSNAPKFLGLSLASGLNSFYNTGVAVSNVFRDKDNQIEANDTGKWISSYDDDLGKYYEANKTAIDLTGFVATSFIPGLMATKGLQAAQVAARAAAAGRIGSNFARATNLLAPAAETYVARAGAELAARSATFSFLNANAIKAVAAGAWQGTLETAAFETAVAATMFKSPVLEDMDAGDIAKNIIGTSLFGGAIGGVAQAASTYFGVGKLLKNADFRAKPIQTSDTTFATREMLPSDKAVLAAQDVARLESFPITPEYVLAQKKAAGETGESLLPHVVDAEVARLNRLRDDNIMALKNEFRTTIRSMSSDDALGNMVTNLTDKMGSDDMMRLVFQSKEIVRAGDTTQLERAAKEMVKRGEAKSFGEAKTLLMDEGQDLHIVLHSGNIGEQIVGRPGYLRMADSFTPEQILARVNRAGFKPSVKMDFSQKLDPHEMELRWMAARRSNVPFPKDYVFHQYDLPALEKAQRMGLSNIKVQVGDSVEDVVDINNFLMQKKAEVLQHQIAHGRKSDTIEAITDIRKDFIEGAMNMKQTATSADTAFNASRSYADELAKFLGKDPTEIKLTDIDLMPRYAKVSYDTKLLKDEDGMVIKGMELIKLREKAAKVSVDTYFGKFAGQLHEMFPDIPEELLRSTWRGEGGAGLLTNAGGAYGSMASMASYIGNLTGELSKARIGALTEDMAKYAQKLIDNPEDAVRFSAINSVVSNSAEKYVMDVGGEHLIPYRLQQYMEKEGIDLKGYLDGLGEFEPPSFNGPDMIKLETQNIRDAVLKHISLNDTRNVTWQELHAIQGNVDEKLAGVFRPIRPDPRDYKHIAFVKDPTMVGQGHTSMIFARDARELEDKIAEVQKLGKYKVYTKQQAEDFYKARGEWEFDKTLHENYVDTDLKSRGIMSNFLPSTDAKKIVNDWVRGEVRKENTLVKESVLFKYQKETQELKRLAAQWDQTHGSRIGTKSVDELLSSTTDSNPYVGLMKSMLNVTKLEEMPIWLRTANEATDAIVSRAWESATKVLTQVSGKGVTQAEVDKINQIFDEVGFRSSYSIAAAELANQTVPRGVLSTFVRSANALLTTTMLRLDAFNAVTNLVGHSILYAPEMQSVLKGIKTGNAEAVGELAKLSRIAVPGTADSIFSPAKLINNAIKRLHGPDSAKLIAEYKARGFVPDLAEQYFKSLDALTLNGMETVKDMHSKIGQIQEALKNFAATGEKWTGNKFAEKFNRLLAVDTMKQITEVAVKHGLMDEKAAWMYVNTFNNRVNGVLRAAERPLMFQGPIGQAMGLFQSYQFNMMQQAFRYLGTGQKKTAAMMLGLQGAVFGASSLPGFHLVNDHLIAEASGNTEHKDLFSATYQIFGKEGADWLMFGAPSNILKASLYTRGDTNPRTWSIVPNPTNPGELPFVSSFAKAFGSLAEATTKISNGGPVWESFLSGIEHMGISRPLAGIAAVGRSVTSDGMQVISTQRNGNIAGSNDLLSLATLVRLAGAKPLDEAVATNRLFSVNALAQADRLKREELASELKGMIRAGSVSDDAVEKFAERYAAYGGRQSGFASWWVTQHKNANVTQTDQFVRKLDNPYARRMQEVMGGRDPLSTE